MELVRHGRDYIRYRDNGLWCGMWVEISETDLCRSTLGLRLDMLCGNPPAESDEYQVELDPRYLKILHNILSAR